MRLPSSRTWRRKIAPIIMFVLVATILWGSMFLFVGTAATRTPPQIYNMIDILIIIIAFAFSVVPIFSIVVNYTQRKNRKERKLDRSFGLKETEKIKWENPSLF